MKALALILLILLVTVTCIAGFLYFFGFVMSFDAPGSAEDPGAWQVRLLFLVPVGLCIVMLVAGFITFLKGRYGLSAAITGIPILLAAFGFIAMLVTSARSLNEFRSQRIDEEKLALKYPIERYLRPVDGGTDTVIVRPNGIVAYRLYLGTPKHWGGPLGNLNNTRDTLVYYQHQDTRLRREELGEFEDKDGNRLSDVYFIK